MKDSTVPKVSPAKALRKRSSPKPLSPKPASRTAGRAVGRPLGSTGPGHDDKRTAILRTAAQLFATHGYEATSLDMIAEQLGMHKATLYHYVSSKDSILYECLLKSFADLDTVIDRMQDRGTPVVDRLRLFVRSLAAAQNNDFGRCLVLVGSRPLDLSPNDGIRRFQRRLDTTVRALVAEGIADKTLHPCDPAMVSALLFGALNWVPHWYRTSGRLSVQQIADGFMDLLAKGVVRTPGG